MEVVPGQWWQRVLAPVLGAGALWLFVTRAGNGLPAAFLWITAILFAVFALLSFPPLYRRWMAFAEWLSVWVTRVIFSIIYLIVLPVVRLLHALSGRSGGNQAPGRSLWIPKRAHDRSLEEMERMG